MIKFLIILFFSIQVCLARGGDVGNGGLGILCQFENDSKPRLYLVDYAAMKTNPFFNIFNYQNYEKSNQIILEKLKNTLPQLFIAFELFIKSYYNNQGDLLGNAYTYWIQNKPLPTHDNSRRFLLPRECLDENQNISSYLQLIARYEDVLHSGTYNKLISHYVNVNKVKELKKNNDQFSWLLFHEWLWNYSKQVEMVHFLNAYFHSTKFLDDHPDDIIIQLNRLNFDFNSKIFTKNFILNTLSKLYRKKDEIVQILEISSSDNSQDVCDLQSSSYQNLRKIAQIVQFKDEDESYSKYNAMKFLIEHPSSLTLSQNHIIALKLYRKLLHFDRILQECN